MHKMPQDPKQGTRRPSPNSGYPQREAQQNPQVRVREAFPASSPRYRETPPAARPVDMGRPARPASKLKRKKSSFLPLFLTTALLLSALVGGYFYFSHRNPQRESQTVSALEIRERTNRFRSARNELSGSLVRLYNGLKTLRSAFTGTDLIAFLPELPESPFVSMEEDWKVLMEPYWAKLMGRVVYPRLGVDSPLADDCTRMSVDRGYGRVQETDGFEGLLDDFGDLGKGGMVSLYGHRILTKNTSMYRAEDQKIGDVFWVDDYRQGKRFVYRLGVIEAGITEEQHIVVNMYPEAQHFPVENPSCMLVVCDPLIYNDSSHRIDSYGHQVAVLPIPSDDQHYRDYLSANGLPLPEADEETAETPAESNP